jgi:hypothetical protein
MSTSKSRIAHLAKTLSFLLPALPRRGSSLQKLKDFAPLWQRCSHRTLFPLAPLRQAALRSIPQRAITAVRSESSSLNLNDSLGEIRIYARLIE